MEGFERRILMSNVIVVYGLGDVGDATPPYNPTLGVYQAATLRDAVVESNTLTGPNTIQFYSTLTGTVLLTQGELEFTNQTTTLQGLGSNVITISGNGASTVFRVDTNATTEIVDLNIVGGNAGSDDGGGIFNHGGTLTLSQCTISGDSADNGGGIYNSGVASITNGTISGCTTTNTFSLYSNGAGIYNAATGTLTVSQCAISGDTTHEGNGGGLLNKGMATLTDVMITGGTGGFTQGFGHGGGIANTGVLSATDTSITYNFGGDGGGMFNNGGTLSFTNGTLSFNQSDQDGGGIKGEARNSHRILIVVQSAKGYGFTPSVDRGGFSCLSRLAA
jgi:hypothetical protein